MRLSLLLLGSVLTAAQAYTPYGGEGGEQNPQGTALPATTEAPAFALQQQTDVPQAIIANDAIAQHQQDLQLDADTEAFIKQLADQCAAHLFESYSKKVEEIAAQESFTEEQAQALHDQYNSPETQQKMQEDAVRILQQVIEQKIPADQRETKKAAFGKEIEQQARQVRDQIISKVQAVIKEKKVEREAKRIGKQAEQLGHKAERELNKGINKLKKKWRF